MSTKLSFSDKQSSDYETSAGALRIAWPEHMSRLTITRGFTVDLPHHIPNPWWRLWQWVFLGFRWGEIEQGVAQE